MKRDDVARMQPARRARRVGGMLLLPILLFAIFLWLKRDSPPSLPSLSSDRTSSRPSRPDSTKKARQWSSGSSEPVPAAPAQPPAEAESGTPIIDAVYLDKTEACRGEQNFVNIEAYTENGTDPFLTFLVTDPATGQIERGSRVAFRQQHASTDPIKVVVQGLGADQTVQLPPVTIKDCDEPVQVHVELARSFSTPDRVALTAKVREPGGSSVGSFSPYEYVWDFDDGQTLTESEGHVEHSYENRSQTARVSSFVVTVTARERGGRSAAGSRTVTFSNFGFLKREFEDEIDIQVGAKSDPEAGSRADRLWLYHGHDQPVRLTQVRMREIDTDPSAGGREVAHAEYNAARALGFSELAPGESRDVIGLAALAPTRPTVVRFYDVEGQSDDGKLAHATFVVGYPHASSDGTGASSRRLDPIEEATIAAPL